MGQNFEQEYSKVETLAKTIIKLVHSQKDRMLQKLQDAHLSQLNEIEENMEEIKSKKIKVEALVRAVGNVGNSLEG